MTVAEDPSGRSHDRGRRHCDAGRRARSLTWQAESPLSTPPGKGFLRLADCLLPVRPGALTYGTASMLARSPRSIWEPGRGDAHGWRSWAWARPRRLGSLASRWPRWRAISFVRRGSALLAAGTLLIAWSPLRPVPSGRSHGAVGVRDCLGIPPVPFPGLVACGQQNRRSESGACEAARLGRCGLGRLTVRPGRAGSSS